MSIRSIVAKFAADIAAASPVRNAVEVHLPPATYRMLLGEVGAADWVQRDNPLKQECVYLHTEAGLVLVAKIEGYSEEVNG